MSEKVTPDKGKVRVYETQSRLIGLHASCALALRSFIGAISPRFNISNTGQSAQAVRLRDCELCAFRSLGNPQLVAHYKVLSNSLRPIQSADDRSLTKGQLEVINFVRQERLAEAHAEIVRDEETNRRFGPIAAVPLPKASAEPSPELTRALSRVLSHEFPPTRRRIGTAVVTDKSERDETTGVVTRLRIEGHSKPARASKSVPPTFPKHEEGDYAALAKHIIGKPPRATDDLDGIFDAIEEREVAKRKPVAQQPRPGEFEWNVPGATGKGRSAVLPKRSSNVVALAVAGINEKRAHADVALEPVTADLVPERVSVAWLKGEVLTLRRKLATSGLAPDEDARLVAYRAALAERGVVEV